MKNRVKRFLGHTDLEAILFKIRLASIALLLFVLPLLIYLDNTAYGYTKLIFALIFTSFILLVWIVEMIVQGSYTLNLTELIWPSGVLLMVCFLSLANAKSIGVGLESIGILIYFFFIYLLVANTVKTRGHIKLLLGVLLVSAVLAALYGLLQFYGVLPGTPGRTGGTSAIISSLGNKNYLGGFLVYLFVPSLILIFTTKRIWIKILAVFSLGIIYLTFIPVSSDGTWGSLVISFVFLLSGMVVFRLFSLLSKNRRWVVALIGVLILAYLLQGTPGPLNSLLGYSAVKKPAEKGWLSSVPLIGRLPRELVRLEDWWVGWEMFKDHPILGIGIGNYKVRFLEYKGIFRTTERSKGFDFDIQRAVQAHNEYVQMGSELGILGILALAFGVFIIFRGAVGRIIFENSAGNKFILLAFLSGVIAFIVHSSVSFPLHLPASALDLVLLLGIINSKYFDKRSNNQNKSLSFFQSGKLHLRKPALWIAVSLLVILSISVSVLAYRDWQADVHLDQGIKELQMGRSYTAREEFNRSLKLSFHPREVLFYLGVVNNQLGDREKAIHFFKKSLNTFVVESTYAQLATLYFQKGDYSEALTYLNTLLDIDPEESREIQARFMIALIDLKHGNIKEALAKMDKLITQYPSYERTYIARADIYQAQGRISEAEKDLRLALKLIEKRLDRYQGKIQKGVTITREEFAQIRSDIETLKKEKKKVKELLEKL